MADKQEILNSRISIYADPRSGICITSLTDSTITESLFAAMDQYAELRAIEFLKWSVDNHSRYEGFSVNRFNDNREETIYVNNEEITLTQLFKLFDEQTKQKP